MRKETKKIIEEIGRLKEDIRLSNEKIGRQSHTMREMARRLGLVVWNSDGQETVSVYVDLLKRLQAITEYLDLNFRTTDAIPAKFEAFKKPKEKKDGEK